MFYFKIALSYGLWLAFFHFESKIYCTALPCLLFVISFRCCWEEFPRRGKVTYIQTRLVFSAGYTEARRFRNPTFIGFKSGAGCTTYLSSKLSQESRVISQALKSTYLSDWTISVVYTLNWKSYSRSKMLALNTSLALLLSVLLHASVRTITIEQYRSRIGCDNFVKAKDAS